MARGAFQDGKVNTLALFREGNNDNAAVYLYRELDYGQAMELPVSLGSHDTLTVWLNGQKVLEQNVTRNCAPDQAQATLKLKAGPNALLMKVCTPERAGGVLLRPQEAGPHRRGGPEGAAVLRRVRFGRPGRQRGRRASQGRPPGPGRRQRRRPARHPLTRRHRRADPQHAQGLRPGP